MDPELIVLRKRFSSDLYFLNIIDALYNIQPTRNIRLREKQRARHRAENYMVEEGKLWIVGGGTKARARAWRECMTKEEAVVLAKEEHERGGHWHRDGIKIALMDRIHRPGLDELIVLGIKSCAWCKNFGAPQLNTLLQPITRRHPFELLVGDYLKLPTGKGGYHTVGLYLDTCSQHVWGYMFKTHGSAKTTTKSLGDIFHTFSPPEVFMSDGGSHFNNSAVTEFCEEWGTKTEIVAAYSPWVNGLVEGTNKLLLYVLARLCAPEVGEDGWEQVEWKDLPKSWPDHFEKAIRILNWRILPVLKFSPKELILGLVVNTAKTPLEASASILQPRDIDTQMAYIAQQRLDGYSEAVHHAIRRKAAFDRKVDRKQGGPITFGVGQLVQIHRSDLHNTLSSDRKLQPMWSQLKRVKEQLTNSYTLEELDGAPIEGRFSARRLRTFEAQPGTKLWIEQRNTENRNEKEADTTWDRREEEEEEERREEEEERRGEEEEEERGEEEEEEERAEEGIETGQEGAGLGFFYDEGPGEGHRETEENREGTIASRVRDRRQGRGHLEGGHME